MAEFVLAGQTWNMERRFVLDWLRGAKPRRTEPGQTAVVVAGVLWSVKEAFSLVGALREEAFTEEEACRAFEALGFATARLSAE